MNQSNSNKKPGFWVKFLITISALASTLGLWNLFSKETRIVTDLISVPSTNTNVNQSAAPTQSTVQPTPFTRLYLGGAAPVQQTYTTYQQPITQTQSSR